MSFQVLPTWKLPGQIWSWLFIYLFLSVHVYVSLVYVGIPICTCVWRSDIGIQYLLWGLFCLILWDDRLSHFERDFLTQSGAQHSCKVSWLMSSRDMPVSTSLLSSSYRPATHAWCLPGAGLLYSDPHACRTGCLLTEPQPYGLVFWGSFFKIDWLIKTCDLSGYCIFKERIISNKMK